MLQTWFHRACLASGIWVAASGYAGAAPTQLELGCDHPLHVAFYEYGSLYHQGIGIDPDILTELAERTGCHFETEIIPRAQAWQKLQDNETDMLVSAIATPARRRFAYFVNYVAFKDIIIARADLAPQIKSFDDVVAQPNWRIGVVQGFIYGAYYDYRLDNIRDRARITAYADQAALYRALDGGAVDLILSPPLNYAFYFPITAQAQRFVMLDPSPAPPIAHGLAINRAHFSPAMVNAWARVIEGMRLDGTLEKIYERRLTPDVARDLLRY